MDLDVVLQVTINWSVIGNGRVTYLFNNSTVWIVSSFDMALLSIIVY
jgi:hypothetical protein